MRFIDTNRPLQPHHGGIAAWHRSGSDAHLSQHFPGSSKTARLLGTYIDSTIIGIADFAYASNRINYSPVDRATRAYVSSMHDYQEAPNDTDRWLAFVVPNTASREQLAGLQANFARLWYMQSLALQEQIRHKADQYGSRDPAAITAQVLGALPTLHTVGFETDGEVGQPVAITGVWVPHVG